MHFKHYQLPKLFAGFHQREFGVPVRYPVACHPQAWAPGYIPYLIQTSLGLAPGAFEQRLRVLPPQLPDFVYWLEVRRLRVGSSHADLRFERAVDGTIALRVMRIDGRLDVVGDGLVLYEADNRATVPVRRQASGNRTERESRAG